MLGKGRFHGPAASCGNFTPEIRRDFMKYTEDFYKIPLFSDAKFLTSRLAGGTGASLIVQIRLQGGPHGAGAGDQLPEHPLHLAGQAQGFQVGAEEKGVGQDGV